MRYLIAITITMILSSQGLAMYKGFNLTEYDGFLYDAATDGSKTDAQKAVDSAKELGSNHIELNIRAKMIGPFSNEIIPVSPAPESSQELRRIVRLMKYIKEQGMTVGLRPIFFVVGPNNEFPVIETLADGTVKTWWHGNIQPSNPTAWFLSFQNYLDRYALVAKMGKADTFTIGAELYSMTVGVEDQWKEYPYGFPNQWLNILRYIRAKLSSTGTKLAYDVNFTDDSNLDGSGILKSGGELERWRYRLVDLANPTDEMQKAVWLDLVQFWKELDIIGIDMYRSLALPEDKASITNNLEEVTAILRRRSDEYAQQLDTTLLEISLTLEVDKKIVFKEIGYRSVDYSFIDPFNYAGTQGAYNEVHQAAGYTAIFESFMVPGFEWFDGIAFWDIPIDPNANGPGNLGFSPIGKPITSEQIRKYFGE